MEFFDKLGKKASEAYKVTADKTGKIAKETKLKLKMYELKSEIDDIYVEIGKKVYEKHIREENISIKKDLESECTKIDVLSDEVEEILKQCLYLRDKKQCLNCYKEINKEDNFCPNCGEKQTDKQPQEEDIIEKLEKSQIDDTNQNEKEIVIDELKNDIKRKKEVYSDEETSKFITEISENVKNSDVKKKAKKEKKDKKETEENKDNKTKSRKNKTTKNKPNDKKEDMTNLEKTVSVESDIDIKENEEEDE